MAKNAGKIDIEMHKDMSNLTSSGGLCSVVKLFFKMGLDKSIDALIGARNERGAKDSEHVLSLVLLNLAGGTAVDNLNFLREKLGFERFGIRIPSPSAGGERLKSFNNPSEDPEERDGTSLHPRGEQVSERLAGRLREVASFRVEAEPAQVSYIRYRVLAPKVRGWTTRR